MVQFACLMTKAQRPTTNTGYTSLRWNPLGGSNIDDQATLWPFDNSDWKSFRVRALREDVSGVTTIQRQVNQVDVGSAIQFSSADTFPVTKADDTIVAISLGDRLAYRFVDTTLSVPHSWLNIWSYIEFADGLWGF